MEQRRERVAAPRRSSAGGAIAPRRVRVGAAAGPRRVRAGVAAAPPWSLTGVAAGPRRVLVGVAAAPRRIREGIAAGSRRVLESTAVAAIFAVTVAACGGDPPAPDVTGESPAPTTPPALALSWEPVVDGLDVPNDLADLGDGRLLIGDQVGRIHLWDGSALADPPVVDLTDRVAPPTSRDQELGLAGFAPHPEFLENGRIFVFYTLPGTGGGVVRVDVLSELTVADPAGAGPADPATERELLRLEQGGSSHVGGHLAFGDDGLLYLGLGDAGRSAQAADPETLPGSIIRIDVDGGDPYGVPPDNPFVAGGGAPEVFAYGFRNPFRVSWDDEVGLIITEPMFREKNQEVNVAVAGANYGYPEVPRRLPDGSCFDAADPTVVVEECRVGPDGEQLQPPVLDYGREFGQIVSGAVRYQGDQIPALAGKVVVADWRGKLLAAEPAADGQQWPVTPVEAQLPGGQRFTGLLWSLGRDAAGEVYGLRTSGFAAGRGVVYRLVPAS